MKESLTCFGKCSIQSTERTMSIELVWKGSLSAEAIIRSPEAVLITSLETSKHINSLKLTKVPTPSLPAPTSSTLLSEVEKKSRTDW